MRLDHKVCGTDLDLAGQLRTLLITSFLLSLAERGDEPLVNPDTDLLSLLLVAHSSSEQLNNY